MFDIPTDPRIERIARAFCRHDDKDPDRVVPFDVPATVEGAPCSIKGEWHQWRAYVYEARRHMIAAEVVLGGMADAQRPAALS